MVLISGWVSARGSGGAWDFTGRALGFSLREVIAGDHARLRASNPLNALPVAAKQDVPARECYVREIARRTALPTCNRGAWPGDSRIGGKTVSYKSGWLGLMTSA